VADHEVIVDAQVEQTRALDELPREPDVLATGGGIAAYAELRISGVMRTAGLCGADAFLFDPARWS
jgi:hypothetical protein